MLNSDGTRVASRSPSRVHYREESPGPVACMPTQPMPVRPVPLSRVTSPTSGFNTEPIVRSAPFDRQATTPPFATSQHLMATPAAPKMMSRPLQRLVIHASTGQLPRPATCMNQKSSIWVMGANGKFDNHETEAALSPPPNSSGYGGCCMVPPYARRPETRSVSPVPRSSYGSYWQAPARPGLCLQIQHCQVHMPNKYDQTCSIVVLPRFVSMWPGWGTVPGPVSVRFNRSPRPPVAGQRPEDLVSKGSQGTSQAQCTKVNWSLHDYNQPVLANASGQWLKVIILRSVGVVIHWTRSCGRWCAFVC